MSTLLHSGSSRLWSCVLRSSASSPSIVSFTDFDTLFITSATIVQAVSADIDDSLIDDFDENEMNIEENGDENEIDDDEEEILEEQTKKQKVNDNAGKKPAANKKGAKSAKKAVEVDDEENDSEGAENNGELDGDADKDIENELEDEREIIHYVTVSNGDEGRRMVLCALDILVHFHSTLNFEISSSEPLKFDVFSSGYSSSVYDIHLAGFVKGGNGIVKDSPSVNTTKIVATPAKNNKVQNVKEQNNEVKQSKKRKKTEENEDTISAALDTPTPQNSHTATPAAAPADTAISAVKSAQKQAVNDAKKSASKPSAAPSSASSPSSPASASSTGDDIKILASGVRLKEKGLGNGPEARLGSRVAIRYRGQLMNGGKVFDSNMGPGQKLLRWTVGDGSMIKGFDEAVKGMKEGGKRIAIIPSHLAYGKKGSPPEIPPNADLIFTVELHDVKA